jgi:mannitol-specific phosphotransferase system IIBC component
MKLLQYFFGIIIAQIAIFSLVMLNSGDTTSQSLLRIAIPSIFIALVISFWFSSIATQHSKDEINRVKDEFNTEKEKIRANAERAKERVRKEAQKEIRNETTKAHAKANFKVGASFAGVLGIGALFVMAQMMTAGLLLISTASGAMGGYYLRGKRARTKELSAIDTIDIKAIESKPKKNKKKYKELKHKKSTA